MKKRLYAAYGSNLNKAQMRQRCPTARLVGTGVVKDFELQFKGHPDSAFATIAPKKGSSVPVAVWELQPRDEAALDRYEGYPSHYFKQDVPVKMDGKSLSVMAYIMNQRMTYGLPSTYYYRTVSDGYRDCGLDRSVLSEAVGRSAEAFYAQSASPQTYQRSFFAGYSDGDPFDDEVDDFDEDEDFFDVDPDDYDPDECDPDADEDNPDNSGDEDFEIFGGMHF